MLRGIALAKRKEIVYASEDERNADGNLKYPEGTGPFYGNREGARNNRKIEGTGIISGKERRKRRAKGKAQRLARKNNL